MDVEIVACNTSTASGTVAINTPQTFNLSDQIDYDKVYYGGILTFYINFNSSCTPLPNDVVAAATSSCYGNYNLSGTQATGFDLSVW